MKHDDIYKRLVFQNVAYGVDESQKIDVIIPQKETVHVIVYIHGGAYLTGDKSQYPSFLLDYSKTTIWDSKKAPRVAPKNCFSANLGEPLQTTTNQNRAK